MKAVIQRVSQASVTIDGEVVGSIENGLLTLLGVAPDDDAAVIDWMARKLVGLRVFNDDEGRFNRSLADVGGSMLVVSQFTLFGDVRSGTRPGFSSAAAPDHANEVYEQFCDRVAELGITVERGVFGAHMDVALVNDGPVTLMVERP